VPQAATRLAALLQSSESKTLDFERLGAGKVAKRLETVYAFADTEGGLPVLGIGDPKDTRPSDRPQRRVSAMSANHTSYAVRGWLVHGGRACLETRPGVLRRQRPCDATDRPGISSWLDHQDT
jgi:hypothetical protein